MIARRLRAGCLVSLALAGTGGCAMVITNASEQLAADLHAAVVNHDDPETVRAGAPAWLLMSDAMVAAAPDNPGVHGRAALMYAAYAGGLVDDAARKMRLTRRARGYGRRALCLQRAAGCGLFAQPFMEFESALGRFGQRDVSALYAAGVSELAYIQAHRGDWDALADLPRAQALLQRVVALDPGHEDGLPHAYLGVTHSLRPPALGGDPETGRRHFEAALAHADGASLMSKVLFAEYYARLVMDRELYERLLQEVLDAEPEQSGHTLSNVLAQERARQLMKEASDHFIDI